MTMNDRAHWREDEWSVAERATYTLGRMIERGTTRVRSYAQIDADCGLERFEDVLAAKEAHAGRCEVEIMAFPQAGLLKEKGVPELMDRALSSGAAVVGGIDPCTLDRDPVRHLDIIFDRGHIPLRAGEGELSGVPGGTGPQAGSYMPWKTSLLISSRSSDKSNASAPAHRARRGCRRGRGPCRCPSRCRRSG